MIRVWKVQQRENLEAPHYCQHLADIYTKVEALFESESQMRKAHWKEHWESTMLGKKKSTSYESTRFLAHSTIKSTEGNVLETSIRKWGNDEKDTKSFKVSLNFYKDAKVNKIKQSWQVENK